MNWNAIVQDIDGQDVKPAITYRDAVAKLLMVPDESDNADTKYDKYKLATKLMADQEVELTAAQVALVKKASGKFGSPLFHGRICDFIM